MECDLPWSVAGDPMPRARPGLVLGPLPVTTHDRSRARLHYHAHPACLRLPTWDELLVRYGRAMTAAQGMERAMFALLLTRQQADAIAAGDDHTADMDNVLKLGARSGWPAEGRT